jgi:hypothetical protein
MNNLEGGFAEHFTKLKSNLFVSNRMHFRYPLVKVEMIDLFVGERGGLCKRMHTLRVFLIS